MALLELNNVFAGYGETEILHGVSARVEEKEIVVIVGPNGAGKSTLVKAAIGIVKPTKGKILFRTEDITGKAPERLVTEGLAYIPQNKNIFPTLTVLENLEMGAITRRPGLLTQIGDTLVDVVVDTIVETLRPSRKDTDVHVVSPLTRAEFDDRVEWILKIFPNLRDKLRVNAGSLSGGEQQMVAMGKALVLDPVLLLVDEPSAGLAPKLVSLIFEKLQEINRRGTAILLVEQNAKRALAMASRGYVLEMGRNRYEGKGEALLTDPEVGRLYLGG